MAATVSLILKVLAVASTGLITLSEVAVSDIPVPIELQYEFVDRKSRLGAWGELVCATLGGVANQELSFPQGTPSDFAFQSVKAEAPLGTEVRGRVDALGASLACESASLDIKGSKGPLGDFRLGNLKNVTMRSKACNMTSYLVPERNITFARCRTRPLHQNTAKGNPLILAFSNSDYVHIVPHPELQPRERRPQDIL